MRAGNEEREKSAERRKQNHSENQSSPLPRREGRVEDERNQQDGDRDDDSEAAVGALLALIFAGPVEVVALGQLNLVADVVDSLADGAAEVATADTVLDGDV